jgi:aminopeptidase N
VLDGEQMELVSVHLNQSLHIDHQVTASSLTINTQESQFELQIHNLINPQDNSSLEGLYLSAGAFCTQCEAEGFRRITYFLDRPDVLSIYDVTVIADRQQFPYLLSNGNNVASGQLDKNKHSVKWSDPFKKPCYLFALVAGDFDLLADHFVTQSGRKVDLQLFVDKGMTGRGQHALDSLKKAMEWDQTEFNLEYDLDVYMIVAVDFFNMGAMENKGLNVFNSKFVLADPATATDEDYFNIEAVIAHEYFHNWTGNRVTCRDWFQLSLKEGLTVFRDQQFSADMSDPVVNRIKNVRVIRQHQFAEDASAMSHAIRPDEVIEMNNFYTVTVYDKGAEVIRMMHTLLGKAGFAKGLACYFQRFDGQAVTCDDFVQAMEDANNKDLSQFRLWYSQSGTPVVNVSDTYDPTLNTYQIAFSQKHPATFEQSQKDLLLIPMAFSLLVDKHDTTDPSEPVQLQHKFELKDQTQIFNFSDISSKPVPSLLHDFCAPVKLNYPYGIAELGKVMADSPDDFSRWDAGQRLFSDCIHGLSSAQDPALSLDHSLAAFAQVLADPALSLSLKAEILNVPSFETLFQQSEKVDIDGLYDSRRSLLKAFGTKFSGEFQQHYKMAQQSQYAYNQQQVGQRKISNLSLKYLSISDADGISSAVREQFRSADNMTDTLAALAAAQAGDLDLFDSLMEEFEHQWQNDPLVLDKWFTLHATTERADILSRLNLLMAHKQFTINNPNRVRSVVGSFAFFNVLGFHNKDGSGYKFVADYLIELNVVNPQVASRIITPLIQWQKVDINRQELMRHQLMRIGDSDNLSKDLFEKISKSLV